MVPKWLDTFAAHAWRYLLVGTCLTIVTYVMVRLYLVTFPIVLALVLSTFVAPLVTYLQKRGLPRLSATLMVVIGGVALFIGIFAALTPPFVAQIQKLQPTLQDAVREVLTFLEVQFGWGELQIDAMLSDTLTFFQSQTGQIASQLAAGATFIVQAITMLTLAIILTFFFVKDYQQITSWLLTKVPQQHRVIVAASTVRAWKSLSSFMRGTAFVAAVDAVGIGIGLAIVGVPLVLPLAFLVFLGGFIPIIGAFLTGMLAVLVALATLGFQQALIVAGIVLLVQQVESNVLQPLVMRQAVSLHPVVTLMVLTAGAATLGLAGVFLAVPLTAVVAAVGNEIRLRQSHGQAEEFPSIEELPVETEDDS